MRTRRALPFVAALLALSAGPVAAQQPSGLVGDFLSDIQEVQSKLVRLADAFGNDQYDWRPAEGIRSVSEVFKHVAADNYYLTAPFGMDAPDDTGIKLSDYATTGAYEHRAMTKEEVIAELSRSFEHLKGALAAVDQSKLSEPMSVFGAQMTQQRLLVMTTTHLHEHLGQAIAYARMNGVVPPWSR